MEMEGLGIGEEEVQEDEAADEATFALALKSPRDCGDKKDDFIPVVGANGVVTGSHCAISLSLFWVWEEKQRGGETERDGGDDEEEVIKAVACRRMCESHVIAAAFILPLTSLLVRWIAPETGLMHTQRINFAPCKKTQSTQSNHALPYV